MKYNFTKFFSMYSCWLLLLFCIGGSTSLKAQNTGQRLTGVVIDSADKAPIPNASVVIKGTKQGTQTDNAGRFTLDVSGEGATLVFSYVSYKPREMYVQKGKPVTLRMVSAQDRLEEVAIVAYGTQKKSSMVASITTVDPKELKGPTSNLTTMLAGRIAGMVAYQRSGEPGMDNASFFIRGVGSFGAGKKDPLILIDGMESTGTDLARLQPDDISGFSVLKDAAASSLYGARGANGVVLVTTKLGEIGAAKFNVRFENSVSSNTKNFKFADNITYMNLANEAVLTRDPKKSLPYLPNKIDHTAAGDDPLLYPNNNWIDQLIKDYTINQRFNMNVSGGGNTARYYVAGTYNVDNGILRTDKTNNIDNNIKIKNYAVRSNVNLKLTPTTEAIIRTSAQFDDYTGPIGGRDEWGNLINGGAAVFQTAVWSNPVMFPAVYPSSYSPYAKHPLFGNNFIGDSQNLYINPYARMVSGYQQYNTSTVNVQLELKQDLKAITEGLSTRLMAYTQRYSYFDVARSFNPFFYNLSVIPGTTERVLNALNPLEGTEFLSYNAGNRIQNTTTYGELALNYTKTFNEKHAVSGMMIGILRNYLTANGSDLQASLPSRNLGLSGRLTYAYDNRYLFESNFGYNGSERFAPNHRFGFFPSAGVGWNVSEEKFFEPLKNVVTRLKLRGTYGLVGNDQIGRSEDRFFYLSNVDPNSAARRYTWGDKWDYTKFGYYISRYENYDITWEKATTTDLGFDLNFKNGLSVVFDYYKSIRSNILMGRTNLPNTMGFNTTVQANLGKAKNEGFDLALDYSKTFGSNWWIQARGNFTYAKNEVLVNEEPDYPDGLKHLSRKGFPFEQKYGLIAERLFVDDIEARNSPTQNFGGLIPTMGGDIKYRDINGDGQITDKDKVPIGLPTDPEIIYGFGFSLGYKGFDVSTFFQGSARSSFFIDPGNITPFALNGSFQNGLLKAIADDHWSEDNRNLHALWPRLTDGFNNNNSQFSTWWLRDGSFLRLKSVEIGYNVPKKTLTRYGLSNFRIYINGSNLAVFSPFKLWDPEMGSKGLGYPVQAVYNIGLNVGF